MRQIETDPTLMGDDDTDVMIPIAPVTKAMTDILNQYVYDTLDVFEAMVVKRVVISMLSLLAVVAFNLIVGAVTKVWWAFFISIVCMLVCAIVIYPILDVVRKRPDPATVQHMRTQPDKASLN